jgi:hypothetical protein
VNVDGIDPTAAEMADAESLRDRVAELVATAAFAESKFAALIDTLVIVAMAEGLKPEIVCAMVIESVTLRTPIPTLEELSPAAPPMDADRLVALFASKLGSLAVGHLMAKAGLLEVTISAMPRAASSSSPPDHASGAV